MPLQEPFEGCKAIGLALFGVELHAKDIVPGHCGRERRAVAARRRRMRGIGEMIAVKIIGLARRDHRMREARHDVVPAHMRNAQARLRIECPHRAADPAQPGVPTMFFARVGQQLHAHANSQKGRAVAAHPLLHRLDQPGNRRQTVHAGRESPHARQDDPVSARHHIGIGGDGNIACTRRDQRIVHRAKIARAIIDQGNGAHGRVLKDPLGRRNGIALARIDLNRLPQGTRECLVAAFGDVMVVLAVQRFEVQRDARRLGKALEPVREQFGVHLAKARLRIGRFIDAVRPPRNVEDAAGQRFVHRRMRFAVTGDAALVAQRLGNRLAQRERRILDGMMLVDMEVALHRHGDVDQRMARQLFDHMVEETDSGGHRIIARPVKIDGNRDIRFLGRALDSGGSHGAPIAPTFRVARRLSPLDPRPRGVHPPPP